jgi:excinuclease ABC subunit B
VGVNLLREGLDLPEVELVAIMDADKEGFLRNQRSLIQTIGRAARNEKGRVVMYADVVTKSMQMAIDETNRRRAIQKAYNKEHGITPMSIVKSKDAIIASTQAADSKRDAKNYKTIEETVNHIAADPIVKIMPLKELQKLADKTKKEMEKAAKDMEFIEAARLRDEWQALLKIIEGKQI